MAAAGTLILIRRFPPSAALEIPSGRTGSAGAATQSTQSPRPKTRREGAGAARTLGFSAGMRGFPSPAGSAIRGHPSRPRGQKQPQHGQRGIPRLLEQAGGSRSSVSALPARPPPLPGALCRPGPCLARRKPWAASACTAHTALMCVGKRTSQTGKSSRRCAQDGCWQLCRGRPTFCRHARACATTNSRDRAPHVGASPRATV